MNPKYDLQTFCNVLLSNHLKARYQTRTGRGYFWPACPKTDTCFLSYLASLSECCVHLHDFFQDSSSLNLRGLLTPKLEPSASAVLLAHTNVQLEENKKELKTLQELLVSSKVGRIKRQISASTNAVVSNTCRFHPNTNCRIKTMFKSWVGPVLLILLYFLAHCYSVSLSETAITNQTCPAASNKAVCGKDVSFNHKLCFLWLHNLSADEHDGTTGKNKFASFTEALYTGGSALQCVQSKDFTQSAYYSHTI